MKKRYTHVLWDFNGTILNDMEAGIRGVNAMLRPRGLATVDGLEAYRELFDFPVEDYYRRLGFDFAKEDYHTVLAPLWVSLYNEYSKSSPLFSGVETMTAALRGAGLHQSILSASEQGMMQEQLRERGALSWFDEIWGNGSIHAYGKEGLAAAWRAAHPDAVAVLLGDTTHDHAVAESIGADCILIAAGHQSKRRLSLCGVPVVDGLADCLPLLLSQE